MSWNDHLTRLFLSYHHDMLHLAWMYLRNFHDAEDVVGDCWVSVMIHGKILEAMNPEKVHAYLMRCVANASIDRLRRKKREAQWRTTAGKDTEVSPCIPPSEAQWADRIVLEAFYHTLPWREAKIFELRMQGLSFPVIAGQLGIGSSTARSYWWRVRQKLKKLIEKA